MDHLTTISTRRTPQSQPADPCQARNKAGGYTFTVTPEQRLRRFLTLGTDSGTYYTSPAELTRDNANTVIDMADTDHKLLVNTIVDVSTRGAAPRQNPTLFALAVAASHGTDSERRYALDQLANVARTGTHLFLFAQYVEQFRGWGRGLRRAVADWYTSKPADSLAYQVVKYRQRGGWSHRDLLRLAHPETADESLQAVLAWVAQQATSEATPRLIEGYLKANEAGADIPALVRNYRLSWEMLPDEALTKLATWDALLDAGIPQTALMRQLPRLTQLGLLPSMGGRTSEVAARLADAERLQAARVHPVNVLTAQRTYAGGRSLRGSGSWSPSRKIVDALDEAFYKAFGAVEPAGKRTMLALDVSGSMGMSTIANSPLTPREASAALALVQMATEPEVEVVGFTSSGVTGPFGWGSDELRPLSISPRQRLDDAIKTVSGLPFGGTDCAMPMRHALANRMPVDTFVVYTDNETWAGSQHPYQALAEYRQKMGIDARLIVVGMTATECSIADPSDPGMLDVAGFDSAVPNLISDFSRGF